MDLNSLQKHNYLVSVSKMAGFQLSVGSNDAYVALSVIIFSLVSFNFLFPCNSLIPLDRRTTAVVGALSCYLVGAFIFPSRRIDLLHAIDFDVLVLLASIMVVNHIVVHLRETKKLIYSFQCLLRRDGSRGFWMLSFIAFIVSPFLTNDGVCLLLVEPVLHTFEPISDAEMSTQIAPNNLASPSKNEEALFSGSRPTGEDFCRSLSTATAAAVDDSDVAPNLHALPPSSSAMHLSIETDSPRQRDASNYSGHSPIRKSLRSSQNQPPSRYAADDDRRLSHPSSSSSRASTASFHGLPMATAERQEHQPKRHHHHHNKRKSRHRHGHATSLAAEIPPAHAPSTEAPTKSASLPPMTREDAFYFLLALACSTNIGSALTYTGNPQNMIVASDAISVMPPYRFTLYMLLPSIVTWYITVKVIEMCWYRNQKARQAQKEAMEHLHSSLTAPENILLQQGGLRNVADGLSTSHSAASAAESTTSTSLSSKSASRKKRMVDIEMPSTATNVNTAKDTSTAVAPSSPTLALLSPSKLFASSTKSAAADPASLLSPRRRRARAQEQMMQRVVRVVSSPLPYIVLVLLFVMIVMIFVDIMPISSLICVAAIVMVLTVVFGNHCCRQGVVWESDHDTKLPLLASTALSPSSQQQQHSRYVRAAGSDSFYEQDLEQADRDGATTSDAVVPGMQHHGQSLGPLTREDKLDSLNDFFEELFKSIDYSLLFIFLGTFIVVENMAETGIPRRLWRSIVGEVPFGTVSSIAGISVFIVIASQLLGNVAVVQLAKPNVGELDDNKKRLAWAIISFVSTVGGNLTITGSAANIIVAEKANRLDPTINMNFFRHFKICFLVTLFSCAIGAVMLYAIISLDNYLFFGGK